MTISEQPALQAPSTRLLIVEDNEDAADLLQELLALAGQEVTVAYTGESAMLLARGFDPDVVLCDIGLPGAMNGYDVARAFRADDHLKGAFLVALTGYGRPDDVDRTHAAGFDAHLTKPIDIATVQELLAQAHEAGQLRSLARAAIRPPDPQ